MARRPPDPPRGGLRAAFLTICLFANWSLLANAQQQHLSHGQHGFVANNRNRGPDTPNDAALHTPDARALIPYAPDERLPRDAVRAPASPAPSTGGISSRIPARSLQDWKVEDIVLLATVDGTIHAADRNTGQKQWALHTENAMVDTIYHLRNRSVDGRSSEVTNDFVWIIEPTQDGDLYGYTPGMASGMKKLGITVKQLVEDYPAYLTDDPPVVYTGEKTSSVYTVDIASGKVLQMFSARHSSRYDQGVCRQTGELDALDDEKCGATGTLTLTRTEYTVGIHSQATSEQICTIKYAEWGPNNRDRDLLEQYYSSKDDRYIHTRHNGDILALNSEWVHNEQGYFEQKPMYIHNFGSPVARVFDVARPLDSTSLDTPLILLPQPLNPSFYYEGNDQVFVNCTANGGWYALSEGSYPLVTRGALEAQSARDDWLSKAPYSQTTIERTLKDALVGVHPLSQTDASAQLPLLGPPSRRPSLGQGYGAPGGVNAGVAMLSGQTESPTSTGGLAQLFTLFVVFVVALAAWARNKDIPGYNAPTTPSTNKGFFKRLRAEAMATPISPRVMDFAPSSLVEETEMAAPQVNADVELQTKTEPLTVTVDDSKESPSAERDINTEIAKPKKKAHRGKRGGKKEAEKRGVKAQEDGTIEDEFDGDGSKVSVKPDIVYQSTSTDKEVPGGLINLEICSDIILGQGSGGTIVFGGKFEGRDVAVKRMLGQYSELASQEVSHLEQSEDHPNVIRYFCRRQDEHFLYIALELCQASLWDVFRDGRTEDVAPKHLELVHQIMQDRCRVLRQLAEGLKHLHAFRIIHRDIKPQNMLIAYPKKSTPSAFPRVVISDFGLCKTLPENASTLIGATISAGTTGWKAPELIFQPKDLVNGSNNSTATSVNGDSTYGVKRAIDIFSLGCVFFYVITGGKHPFDDDEGWMGIRERNIKANRCNLGDLEIHGQEIKDLVSWMISPNPEERPTAADVLAHPFFWTAEDKLEFLTMASDRFDLEERDPPSDALRELESYSEQIIGPGPSKVIFGSASPMGDGARRGSSHQGAESMDKSPSSYVGMPGEPNFLSKLDKKFIDTLGRQRKYQGYKLADLLRALRNKHNHWDDMPDDVKLRVGTVPDGYYHYWETRFPALLVGVWKVVKDVGMISDRRFDRWYCRKTDV